MPAQSFKNLVVWQKASEYSVDIYRTLDGIKDYSFKDQIQRAALSIPNNIAEGYARRSDKALRNFLSISKGSAAEVESMLVIANRLGYIQPTKLNELTEKNQRIQKLLSGFIRKL